MVAPIVIVANLNQRNLVTTFSFQVWLSASAFENQAIEFSMTFHIQYTARKRGSGLDQ